MTNRKLPEPDAGLFEGEKGTLSLLRDLLNGGRRTSPAEAAEQAAKRIAAAVKKERKLAQSQPSA